MAASVIVRGVGVLALLASGASAASAASVGEAARDGASPPHDNPACRAGQAYVAAGNAFRPDRIAEIFAQKVDFTGPDGVKRQDHADIAALYASLTGKADVVRRVAHLAPVGPQACLMEMENSENGGPYAASAVAHFEVDEHGKVVRFLPFVLTSRGAWMGKLFGK